MELVLYLAMQSCGNSEYSSGLRSVLRNRVQQLFLPIHTCWGQLVRKSRIQLYMVAWNPRSNSLWVSLAEVLHPKILDQ